MAYQNILFPNPKLIHGLRKEVAKQTKIISNGNIEYRLSKQNNFRQIWIWPGRAMSQTDINAIITFADTVDMAKDSFNFYCPFKKQNFKARFVDASLTYTAEALDSTNTIVYSSIGDIALIEVFE